MVADDQISAGIQFGHKTLKNFPLEVFLEIGKHQVAAKDEIERTLRQFGTDILFQELNALTEFTLDSIFVFFYLKGLPFPLLGQFFEGPSRIGTLFSPFDHVGIPFGGYDPEGKISSGFRQYSHIPDNGECVCFLPRSGTCAPAKDLFLLVLPGLFSQCRENFVGNIVKNSPVTVKPADGYVA
jgi:hypothetical protein